MDRLPQEIIDRIALFVERIYKVPGSSSKEQRNVPSSLPPLATLSSAWKRAIEIRTFQQLSVSNLDFEDFRRVVTGHRRAHVRRLRLNVVLPNYSDEDCGRIENGETMVANNECFTHTITTLFSILKDWEDDHVPGTMSLLLDTIYAPRDRNHRDREELYKNMGDVYAGKREDLFDQRYEASILELSYPADLPTVNRITKFASFRAWQRRVALWSIVDISLKLPSLETITWGLDDTDTSNESRTTDQSIRTRSRLAAALALQGLESRCLKTADIRFDQGERSGAHFRAPDLIPRGWRFDPLSNALRILSTQLTTFTLSGTFDSTLFWPSEPTSHQPLDPPTWPNLKTLAVDFKSTTTDGSWYFTGQPQTPDLHPSYSALLRRHPDDHRISPFLLAFAKSLQRMPMLDIATLTCAEMHGKYFIKKNLLAVGYYAPGMRSDRGDESREDIGQRRVYYEVGRWRPDEEVLAMMRGAGRERFGGEILEKFFDRLLDSEANREEW